MAFGNILAGAGGGALTGATLGSSFGPIGTGIGAGLGALAGGIAGGRKSAFTTPEKTRQFQRFTPGQQQLQDQLVGEVQKMLGPGSNYQQAQSIVQQYLSNAPGAFEAFEAPAMRQFQEEIIPGVAERFSRAGAGAQGSSAFQRALSQESAALSERLASQRANIQLGLIPGALQGPSQFLGQAMEPSFHTEFTPSGPSGLAKGFAGVASGVGSAFAGQGGQTLIQALIDAINSKYGKGGVKAAPSGVVGGAP